MSGFAIGAKIRELRIRNGLTQEELANRSELSKGFISQIESEQTSPSIATLVDILECLGTNLRDFFNEATEEKIVFTKKDYFETENLELGNKITWLVPNCQKNDMEPIVLTLEPGGKSSEEEPHNGEEFGIVLQGTVMLHIGDKAYKVKKGESFYFLPFSKHYIANNTTKSAKVLWVVTPPSF
ncbi:MAG: cupin domain-containing protein [Clostridiaceae bacterium]|nr:cupin domain-containing protein [Clostridiaceae bacterium]